MWPEGLHMHTQEAHLQSVIQTDLLAAPDTQQRPPNAPNSYVGLLSTRVLWKVSSS